MSRPLASVAGLCCLIALAVPRLASAQTPAAQQTDRGIPAPVAGRPPDSDAPPGSAAHWLPHDTWVHLHWVPFDEARLQQLLRASRRELWEWLRHDVQTLAELGAKRGYASARKLAAALVAPRAKDVSPALLRELRARTLRVLVQGHLSQHLIFHSLHQEAGRHLAYTTDAGVAAGGGPGGLRVMVTELKSGTVSLASPVAPMGSFDTTPALQPQGASLCSLAPPAW